MRLEERLDRKIGGVSSDRRRQQHRAGQNNLFHSHYIPSAGDVRSAARKTPSESKAPAVAS